MNFSFTDEQLALRDMVRKFAEKELKPYYTQWDREKKYPRHLNKKIGELGLIGMALPTEKGGMGASHVSEGIACEEASRGDCALTMSTFVVGHLDAAILSQGNERIRKEFLAGPPGHVHYLLEDLSGIELIHRLPGVRVDEVVVTALIDGLHELLRHGDGQVKVAEDGALLLGADEPQDIRVVDVKDGHVGPPTCPSLLDDVGGDVEDAHE